jgi:hypothetical protein
VPVVPLPLDLRNYAAFVRYALREVSKLTTVSTISVSDVQEILKIKKMKKLTLYFVGNGKFVLAKKTKK